MAVLDKPYAAAAPAGRRCCAVACILLTAVADADLVEGAILERRAGEALGELGEGEEALRRLTLEDARVARRRIVQQVGGRGRLRVRIKLWL